MRDGAGPSDGASREQDLADLLDRLIESSEAGRQTILAEIAALDPAKARELAELLAALPDPERLDSTMPSAEGDARIGETGDQDRDGDRFPDEPMPGETLGGCVLESVLGRGGVGTVFAARQAEPPRPVAIKVLRVSRTRARDIERFRREASALARLEHPAIARIYASGIGRRGDMAVPYIVMERIDGARSIVDWARARDRTLAETARAFATVCDGMQQGHNRGVVHRDLKPSNILVDGGDRPRVIDFGVARLVSGDDDAAHETVVGALIGTPAYMAPEQFELPGSEIDARVDIHAIGLILYEALLGRRAYEISRDRAFDSRRIVRETDPPVPHRVDSHIPADLSAIVMKAMAKDRDRRYPSMSALEADLRAFAEGRAVSARPETGLERFGRLLRRNPVPSAALVIAIVSLVAAVVVSVNALGAAKRRTAAAELVIAMTAASEGNAREALSALERIETPPNPIIGGMIERMLDDSIITPVAPSVGHLVGGAISSDGSRWIAGGDGGAVVVVDAGGHELGRANLGDTSVWATAFSRDGMLAYAGDWSGAVFEIDLAPIARGSTGKPERLASRRIAGVPGLVRGLLLSRDGKRLVALSSPLVVSDIDLATGAVRSSASAVPQGMARSLAWSGEGRAFAVGGSSDIAAFDLTSDAGPVPIDLPWLSEIVARPSAVALSPNGSLLAVGSAVGHVRVVDVRTGERRLAVQSSHDVWSIDFSRDSSRIAVAERSGRVHEFAVADGLRLARHGTRSSDPAWAACYAPDGSLFANIGLTVARFAGDRGWSTSLGAFPRGLPRATVLLDRNGAAPTLRAAAADGTVWDLEIAGGVWREIPLEAPVAPGPAAFDLGGTRLAAWSDSGVEIASLEGGARVRVPLAPRGRRELAWDPAGDQLAVVSEGEVAVLRDDGTVVGRTTVDTSSQGHDIGYEATRKPVVFIRYSDCVPLTVDGTGGIAGQKREVASATRILRIDSRWVLPTLGGPVLVSHSGGMERLRKDAVDFDMRLVGHTDVAFTAAVTPDGRMLATAGADTRIRFWDLARAELLATAMVCDRPVRTVEWLDQGRALLVVDASGQVLLLDSVARRTRVAQPSTR